MNTFPTDFIASHHVVEMMLSGIMSEGYEAVLMAFKRWKTTFGAFCPM
jgi:hypothetical protein